MQQKLNTFQFSTDSKHGTVDGSLHKQRGESLVETLFAIVFFAVVALGLAYSNILSSVSGGENLRHFSALQLANDKLEELSMIDPQLLDNTYDATETDLQSGNLNFTRTTNVEINADRSRTVTVRVSSNADNSQAQVALTTSYALWGTR